jgi:CMP-N-acetylneuraminic acid synthetase
MKHSRIFLAAYVQHIIGHVVHDSDDTLLLNVARNAGRLVRMTHYEQSSTSTSINKLMTLEQTYLNYQIR